MLIGIRHIRFDRSFVGVLALALMLAAAGCGDDDEPSATTEAQAPPAAAETETEAEAKSETKAEPETEAEREVETETEAESPEDQRGGAGDEEPARTLALFTGENRRITPRVVRVPAFISIRVELRSRDGREYGLKFEGETIRVSGGLASVSTSIDGLRPGEAVVGRPAGAANRVRIEATAEPGP